MRYFAASIALLALLALPLAAEAEKEKKDQALVNFAGALKRVTKKEVIIETEANNEMTFVRTKRTRFVSGGRTMDGASLPSGITVSVEGFEKLNREIEAVTVTVAVPDHSPNM
ncbi:MAG: hypothetical protein JSU00_06570 [Acidobacteria bacterium]|nr:hypothetical protein [Acidobacteriota bacterium]